MDGGRLLATGGTMAWYSCPMPSAEAVGSKEDASLERARRHACTMDVITVMSRMRLPAPALMTSPWLTGMIIVNAWRSVSDVSRRVVLKVPNSRAQLRAQPKAMAREVMDMSSRGTRTEPGVSKRRIAVESMTRRLVRKDKDPWKY
jgi:hypothetical protein